MFLRVARVALPVVATLAVLSTASFAQPAPGTGGPSTSPLLRGKYTKPTPRPQIFESLTKGLPDAILNDIIQDPRGFMWFATNGGVARYDGYSMRTFTSAPDSPKALNSSFATALEIDKEGRIWIGTGNAGISVYDPDADSLTHYREGPQSGALGADGITALLRDSEGSMWVGTSTGVLDRFDAATKSFTHFRAIEELDTAITTLAQAEGRTLWIGTIDAGLFRFDIETGDVLSHYLASEAPEGLTHNEIRAVFQDEGGVVWVGTADGLNRLDPKTGTFDKYRHDPNDPRSLSNSAVSVIYKDSRGILWVGTDNGLNRKAPKQRGFERFMRDPAAPLDTAAYPAHVRAAFESEGGLLWFGTASGVVKLDRLVANFHPYVNLTGADELTAFVDGGPGIIWAGTYSNGLYRIDGNTGTVTVYTSLGPPDAPGSVDLTHWISTLYRDKQGVLWIAGDGMGLVRFDPRTEQHAQYLADPESEGGPSSDTIHDIVEDRNGFLWLATWGGGLNRFDRRWETFVVFHSDNTPNSISSDYIYNLHMDAREPGVLWVGMAQGGLNRFDLETQQATRYSLRPKGSGNVGYDNVQTIHQDANGVLWAGTDGGGLVRFDPKTKETENFTKQEGLTHDTVYGILSDDDGALWISTSDGLSVFNPLTKTFVNYTTAHGLVSNAFMQNSYYRSGTGEMFFGSGFGTAGDSGFNRFEPSEVAPAQHLPRVALSSFQLFGEEAELEHPIWTAPDLSLGYTDSVFSFEFVALAYAAPDSIRYSYKMDGLHDWIETSRRFVTYSNISGGDYVFRVKASNRHGKWSEEETTVEIHVASPPWKTWWAYTLYALIVLSLVLAYLRYQARKVTALRQAARLQAVERDLELTGAVQQGFLPRDNALESSDFGLFGFYRPADQAGGDWWWYEASGSKLTVLIGDVTGHGPGAAMVTAAVATAFRIQNPETPLPDRLRVCHEEVLRVAGGTYNMTVSAIELDCRSGRFTFYSAGGLPIIRIRYDGRPRTLPCTGTPLGGDELSLGKVENRMAPGERLLLYTDGIPEMPLGGSRLLGMRRFSMICESTGGLDLANAAQKIVLVSDSIRQNTPQLDDWTFAMLEWRGSGERRETSAGTGTGTGGQWTDAGTAGSSEWPRDSQPDGWSRPSNVDRWLGQRKAPGEPDDGSGSGGAAPA